MKTGILLSGGIDSIALAQWKRPQVAFTIDYGQRPAIAEIEASAPVCNALGIEHHIIKADCSSLGSGDLAGLPAASAAPSPEWWPYRNQLLVTLAAMKGIALGVSEIMVGSVKTDGFHADGREEFFNQLNSLVSMQEGGIIISAPAIGMTSSELVRISEVPSSLLAWAHSCHVSNFACGNCRGCYKHQNVMNELGYGFY